MSDKPTTGEWTAESVYALGIFTADFGVRMARIINAALAAEQRKHDRELADYARKQSNVLEAERLHNESTIVDIEQQLAAERGFHAECEKQLQACFDKLAAEMEKVQTLVDALKLARERARKLIHSTAGVTDIIHGIDAALTGGTFNE